MARRMKGACLNVGISTETRGCFPMVPFVAMSTPSRPVAPLSAPGRPAGRLTLTTGGFASTPGVAGTLLPQESCRSLGAMSGKARIRQTAWRAAALGGR